jgi:hypothetical protein
MRGRVVPRLHSLAGMPLALLRRSSRSGVFLGAGMPPIWETDLDRILKLIPSELLLLYTAVAPASADVPWRYFGVFLVAAGAVLAPVILYLDGRSTGQPARWQQYVVRTLTFIACALAIAWPFASWIERELWWLRSLSVLAVPFAGALLLRERAPEGPM